MKHLFIMLTLLVGIVSAEWLIETVDSSDGFTSIVLDSSNKPHISYVDYGYGIVKYAYFNGVSWQIEIADDVSGGFLVLCWSSISLDSLENPHIAYTKSAGWTADLRYAQRISSTWQTETVDFNGGYYTSITLDSSNHPHIAYAGYYGMRHAYWGGSAWQLETADELENYGFRFPSIVLDTSDYPHISYYDYYRCDLKFARWDGLAWQVEIVDSVHAVGMYTSLDLDSTGNPHIAYYDYDNEDLKYAYVAVPAPVVVMVGHTYFFLA